MSARDWLTIIRVHRRGRRARTLADRGELTAAADGSRRTLGEDHPLTREPLRVQATLSAGTIDTDPT